MAEELQGLLERIQSEGVKKAEATRDELIAKAKKEADETLAKARKEAGDIRKNAEEEAKLNQQRAEATIRQAARDVLISLTSQLQSRLAACAQYLVAEAMTPQTMADIVKTMASAYAKDPSKDIELSVILPDADSDKAFKALLGALGSNLKKQPELLKGHDFAAGLQIGFKGSDVFFDFSDSAVSQLVCQYAGPRLAAIIEGDKGAKAS